MYAIIDLLHELSSDDQNRFYPNHTSFNYDRISRKAESDRLLSEIDSKRVAEIAMLLHLTRNISTIKLLQKELAKLAEHKTGLNFVANTPDDGYSISLVFNETRPNISLQVKIFGIVDLTDIDCPVTLPENFPINFPTNIYRNYTIVRDGICNVKILPVSVTRRTFQVLIDNGVITDCFGSDWIENQIYQIDLTTLPLVNQNAVSIELLFSRHYELLMGKAKQKAIKYYLDIFFPMTGLEDLYGMEVGVWLSSLGIKDYGYSPRVELEEETVSYTGKELKITLSGLSSLPRIEDILVKIKAKKKLTMLEAALEPTFAEVENFLELTRNKNVGAAAGKELLRDWLISRKSAISLVCQELVRDITMIKFSVIVGQECPWRKTLTMNFDGKDVICTATLREIEIKI